MKSVENELKSQILVDGSTLKLDVFSETCINTLVSVKTSIDFQKMIDARRGLGYSSSQRVEGLTRLDWAHDTQCHMYLSYYSSQYIPRIQLDLLDIMSDLDIHKYDVKIIDIGVGPGTTVIAFFSLMELIHAEAKRMDRVIDKWNIQYVSIDKNIHALSRARDAFSCLKQQLEIFTKEYIIIDYSDNCVDVDKIELAQVISETGPIEIYTMFNILQEVSLSTKERLLSHWGRLDSNNQRAIIGEYKWSGVSFGETYTESILANDESMFEKFMRQAGFVYRKGEWHRRLYGPVIHRSHF